MRRRSKSRQRKLQHRTEPAMPPLREPGTASSSINKRNRALHSHRNQEQRKAHLGKSRNGTKDAHLCLSAEDTSSTQTVECSVPIPERVDNGFIQTTQTTSFGARFCHSGDDDNMISWDFLHENGLLPQTADGRITLSFWLDSQPETTYKLEFKVVRIPSFNVSLGIYWYRAAEKSDAQTASMAIERPFDGKLTLVCDP